MYNATTYILLYLKVSSAHVFSQEYTLYIPGCSSVVFNVKYGRYPSLIQYDIFDNFTTLFSVEKPGRKEMIYGISI